MGKRMKWVCTPFSPGKSSPPPVGRPARPIRPTKRVQGFRAVSALVASTAPRVTLVIVVIVLDAPSVSDARAGQSIRPPPGPAFAAPGAADEADGYGFL